MLDYWTRVCCSQAHCTKVQVQPKGECSLSVESSGYAEARLQEVQSPPIAFEAMITDGHGKAGSFPALRRQGLGLAIIRMIVDAHGSSIKADARERAGTAMRVRLPLARPAREVPD